MSKASSIRGASLAETGIDTLSACGLFKGIPADHLEALEENSEVSEFAAGHTFFHPGEPGRHIYFLEKGQVQTFRSAGDKKLIVAELRPPAIFGEMGCVGRCVYHCYAQATEPSRIRTLSRAQLDELSREFPFITRYLLDLVSERFVHVLLDLEETSFRHLIPRLAKLLLKSAKEDCVQGLTHRDIAEHLRVYRESATAALGELRKAGIIAVERKQIRIINRVRLERAACE